MNRPTIPDRLLPELSQWVARRLGLNFPPDRWNDLRRGLENACVEYGIPDGDSCAKQLLNAPLSREQLESLASHLTIGETYFLRDEQCYRVLEQRVLPQLLESRRHGSRILRVWSAGCSSGEEPYSLAMLLRRLLPDGHDWRLTILATDINTHALRKAAKGLYSQWSFRGTPDWLKTAYFQRLSPAEFQILPEIQRMVTFEYLNLATDPFPSFLTNTNAMDLILCRNVLMYFVPEIARNVAKKFAACLSESGWLGVSPCDATHLDRSDFEPAGLPQAVFYRKAVAQKGASAKQVLPRSALRKSNRPAHPSRVATSHSGELSPQGTSPAPPRAALQLAAELLAEGRHSEAAELAKKCHSSHPADGSCIEFLARLCANAGQLDQALEWCDQGIAMDKLNHQFHFLRASVLQEQGRWQAAAAALQNVVYLAPDFVLAHFNLGNIARHDGEHAEAAQHFRRALALLRHHSHSEILPESDGITAGRMREIIESTMRAEVVA